MSKYLTDKRVGTIYKIENLINHKVYIGQTIMDVKDRWYRHCEINGVSESEKAMPIKRALLKYGKENFSFEVIEEVPKDSLDDREKYWIDKFDSYRNGYNATAGGKAGIKTVSISEKDQKDIVELYLLGFSLRAIGREFEVDKKTISTVLKIHGIAIREVRNYSFTSEERSKMVEMVESGIPRKEVCALFRVSKSYLSQLINKTRRI